MQRIHSCSFKQERWINKWCLKIRTDFWNYVLFSLIINPKEYTIRATSWKNQLCFYHFLYFSWTLNLKQTRSAGNEVWCARAKSIFSQCLTLASFMLFRASMIWLSSCCWFDLPACWKAIFGDLGHAKSKIFQQWWRLRKSPN